MTHSLSRPRRRSPMNPKPSDRVDSRGHCQWIRGRDKCCVADGDFGPGAIVCSGSMQAHHIRTAANSGTALKPGDDQVVAICSSHHRQAHDIGQETFQRMYKVDLMKLAAEYWRDDTYHRSRWENRNA